MALSKTAIAANEAITALAPVSETSSVLGIAVQRRVAADNLERCQRTLQRHISARHYHRCEWWRARAMAWRELLRRIDEIGQRKIGQRKPAANPMVPTCQQIDDSMKVWK